MDSVVVDTSLVQRLLVAQGKDISRAARAARVSRQTLYNLLKEGYRPLPSSLERLAKVLGVSPLDLLVDSTRQEDPLIQVLRLVELSRRGQARAFEVLPAEMRRVPIHRLHGLELPDPREHQLLAAALDTLIELGIRQDDGLDRALAWHHARKEPSSAIFFGASLMPPELIIARTPPPMARHMVFGAFSLESFGRHLDVD